MKKFKKMNKKTKQKIINITDTAYTILLNLVVFGSIITKEYGLGIILMLIQIYVYLINLDFKVNMTIQIPNNDPIEVKKSVKKNKS
jgi:hypothetical protein